MAIANLGNSFGNFAIAFCGDSEKLCAPSFADRAKAAFDAHKPFMEQRGFQLGSVGFSKTIAGPDGCPTRVRAVLRSQSSDGMTIQIYDANDKLIASGSDGYGRGQQQTWQWDATPRL